MVVCRTLSYFFARKYTFMDHNNDPMASSQVVGIQKNTHWKIWIKSYFYKYKISLIPTWTIFPNFDNLMVL